MARLHAHPLLGAADGSQKTLHSTYYDTPDLVLRKAGVSLRVRESGGRFVQTIKSSNGHAGLFNLSFPKIISGRIGGAVQPGSGWRQWRQIVGLRDVAAHLSAMPSACALDCNTPHKQKEFAASASR